MAETTRPGWSRRTKIILASAIAAVLLIVAGIISAPYIYAHFMASDAPDAPVLTPDAGGDGAEGEAALDPAEFAGTWGVVDGYAGYRVDEVLRGQNVTVVGRTEQVSGEFTLDGEALTDGSVVVDVATIATDNGNRDDYFRNEAMQADEYPSAEFTLTEPIALPGDAVAGEIVQISVVGEMTMRDVTQEVAADLEVVFDGERARVIGSIPVVFADYGIEAPSLGFVEVESEGVIEFELALERS